MAKFLGTSSPNTICTAVAIPRAIAMAIPWLDDAGSPTASTRGSRTSAMVGSAMKPRIRDVTVMPS